MKRTLSTEVLPAVVLVAAIPLALWIAEFARTYWRALAEALR
jgi:hypothetical protein